MRQPFHVLRAAALGCALCSASLAALAQATGDQTVNPAVARQQKAEIAKGDPARWHRADATNAAKISTQKKEIAAAYAEAKNACRKASSSRRATCLKQARSTWQHDLAAAPTLVAEAPQSSRLYTTTTPIEPAPGQPASPMMGASQGGQTQSGASGSSQAGQTGSGTVVREEATRPQPVPPQSSPPVDDTVPQQQPQQR